MKFCKSIIISFPILFFALFSQANAQACGKYHINLTIQNEDGKPIENAVVQLLPLENDETRGKSFVRDSANLSLFSINYSEGYSFSSFHKLTISADGFKTTENQVRFTSCQQRDVTVKLAGADSSSNAVWQFINNVNVQTVGGDGKNISDVKLTISGSQINSRKVDMKFGFLYFYLTNGEYNFRFEKPGYQTEEVKVDLTPLSGKNLEIELKPLTNKPNSSILTGTVYDANGAVIVGIKIAATNKKGERFEAVTNDEGIYVLNLPFNLYDPKISADFKIEKYAITVNGINWGFEQFILKDFKFVPSYTKKMSLDIALDTNNSNCGVAGCLPIPEPVEVQKTELINKILQRPLEKLPKEQNKTKRKNN